MFKARKKVTSDTSDKRFRHKMLSGDMIANIMNVRIVSYFSDMLMAELVDG